jgi:hypothetical protein
MNGKYKIRFTLNQLGLQLEQWINGDWRVVGSWNNVKIQELGGVQQIKTKCLQSIRDYELVPAGEYKDAPNITITCV